jgi:hypothetical protein
MKGKGLKGQDEVILLKKKHYITGLWSLQPNDTRAQFEEKKSPWKYLEYEKWVGEVREENYDN